MQRSVKHFTPRIASFLGGKGISFGGLTRSHIKGHAAAAGTRDMDMLLDSLLMNPFNC